MKWKMVLLILCAITCGKVQAQTWDEWFKQKKTQTRYLLEQIAALKVYIEFAQKGYSIVSDGLGVIRKIKDGDFSLHETRFTSLKIVNPRIMVYSKVAATIALQTKIVRQRASTIRALRESGQFTSVEIAYCSSVFDRLLTDCLHSIDELYTIITSGKLELKDDERIKHIDRLYGDMQNKYAFCSTFGEEAGVLAMHRQLDEIEVKNSKIINQLP